ncbi:rho-type GTPase activating protein Rga3 [Schizosaccharomyces octosporus yFS286]|uniref:Rho-type GTPase activating protein Rga3 n=1 Tax=Schizosaccharomyces octosporus (strain yFS286) TaxID=483514 RepID=S9PVY3_SCHOY|nr:rho-type GTPase activating protein Rga3 [Schizosaccharomyces octosporus yFS286]EPX73276.1 rho-type GTPase activating protein Rga3 [Schizosaccharomyces octosporus yFS286]
MGFRKNFPLGKSGNYCTRCEREFQRKETPISFGGRLWHNGCFTCAKCLNNLEQSNQLLIQTSDGKPVCSDCSHTCTVCQKAIQDYALMNGFDSYHRDCFRCSNCRKVFNNSEFVKDGRTVYCSDCSSQNSSFMSPPMENAPLRTLRTTKSPSHEKASSQDSSHSSNPEIASPKSKFYASENRSNERVLHANGETTLQINQTIPTESAFQSVDSLFSPEKNKSSTSFNSFGSPKKDNVHLNAPSPSSSPLHRTSAYTNDRTLTPNIPLDRKAPSPFKTISSSNKKTSTDDFLNDFGFAPHQKQHFFTAHLNRSQSNQNIHSLSEINSNPHQPSFLSPHNQYSVSRAVSPKSQVHRKSSSQPSNIYGLPHFVSSPETISSGNGERGNSHGSLHVHSGSSLPTLVSPSNPPFETKVSESNSNTPSSDSSSFFESYKIDMEALKLQINKLTHLTESISSRSIASGSESSLNLTEKKDALRTQKLEVCEKFFSFADVADDPILKDPLHQSLVAAANAYMKMLRDNFSQELSNLLERRNELLQDYSNAQKLLSESLEASVHLNAKNLELADLNNSLAKQIQQKRELPQGAPQASSGPNNLFLDTKSLKPHSSDSGISNPDSYQPSTSPLQASFNKLELRGLKLLNSGKASNRKSHFKSFHAKSKSADPVIVNETPVCQHVFQVNAIFKPSRCFICSETIWGSEVRCMKCSVACHSRCVKKLYSGNEELKFFSDEETDNNNNNSNANVPEMPSRLPPPEPSPLMFGRPLEVQAKIDKQSVPKVVQICAECVDAHGLHIEGIYRISGSASQVRAFIDMFEQNSIQVERLASDITACTSVLKTYLHKLPIPIIPDEQYRKLLKAEELDDGFAKEEMFRMVLQELPVEHISIFNYLLQHLLRVADNADKNLMTRKNLATVFAPTLMRETDMHLNLKNVNKRSAILQYILESYETLFTDTYVA